MLVRRLSRARRGTLSERLRSLRVVGYRLDHVGILPPDLLLILNMTSLAPRLLSHTTEDKAIAGAISKVTNAHASCCQSEVWAT